MIKKNNKKVAHELIMSKLFTLTLKVAEKIIKMKTPEGKVTLVSCCYSSSIKLIHTSRVEAVIRFVL